MAPAERRWPFDEQVSVQELESGHRRLVDAAAGTHYAAQHADFLARCHQFARQEGIDYGLFDTGVAPEQTLREYLLRRSRRGQVSGAVSSGGHL